MYLQVHFTTINAVESLKNIERNRKPPEIFPSESLLARHVAEYKKYKKKNCFHVRATHKKWLIICTETGTNSYFALK